MVILQQRKKNKIIVTLEKSQSKKSTFLHLKALKHGKLLIKEVLLHLLLPVMMLVILLSIQRKCMPLTFMKKVMRLHFQVWMFMLKFHHLATLHKLIMLKQALKLTTQQTLKDRLNFLWKSNVRFMPWDVNFRACRMLIKPLQFLCTIKFKLLQMVRIQRN